MTISRFKLFASTLCACLTAGAAGACNFALEITFREGAPVDRFLIQAIGDWDPEMQLVKLGLDFGNTPGKLYLDPTSAAPGVGAIAPFNGTRGTAVLEQMPTIYDGDTQLALDFAQFGRNDNLEFSIDLDDRLSGAQITVANSEIANTGIEAVVKLPTSGGDGIFFQFDDVGFTDGNQTTITGECVG